MNKIKDLEEVSYDPSVGSFCCKKGGSAAVFHRAGGTKNGGEYLSISISGKRYYAHRLAFYCMTGQWPKKHVDHINGDKMDNRWCNLREANMAQNKANEGLRSTNTSGWKGVSWNKGAQKWRSYIGATGEHLGLFDCPVAAHLAYVVEADKRYGKFARAV